MNRARYLFRIDDVAPTMNWESFWTLMRLFQRSGVKPLLGIVPDNRDQRLAPEKAHPEFWDRMRLLQSEQAADFGQHGYQHLLMPINKGPRLKFSEFATLSYEEQLRRITAGQRLLRDQGILAEYWVAPHHSYDRNTLRALKSCGFKAVSDGAGLYPFIERGLVFVPQQFWRPRLMPCGVITILLHTNRVSGEEMRKIEEFVNQPLRFSSFSTEVENLRDTALRRAVNAGFSLLYHGCRAASAPRQEKSWVQTQTALIREG
ncbi:MAG TPA: DUF2334 domain-containing protein [Oligoflexia bacterium]|nr:DUF2334 domain-containing protein [Oligoflexia bacterium]